VVFARRSPPHCKNHDKGVKREKLREIRDKGKKSHDRAEGNLLTDKSRLNRATVEY